MASRTKSLRSLVALASLAIAPSLPFLASGCVTHYQRTGRARLMSVSAELAGLVAEGDRLWVEYLEVDSQIETLDARLGLEPGEGRRRVGQRLWTAEGDDDAWPKGRVSEHDLILDEIGSVGQRLQLVVCQLREFRRGPIETRLAALTQQVQLESFIVSGIGAGERRKSKGERWELAAMTVIETHSPRLRALSSRAEEARKAWRVEEEKERIKCENSSRPL
jgi:hypothetical protein